MIFCLVGENEIEAAWCHGDGIASDRWLGLVNPADVLSYERACSATNERGTRVC